MNRFALGIAAFLLAVVPHAVGGPPTDTTFTYQGELKNGGSLANGNFSLDFALWDALVGGSPVGSTISLPGVSVSDGRFVVELNFGAAAMNGEPRWLEIAVGGDTLTPRQDITAAPIASQLRGVFVNDAADFVGVGRENRIGSEYFGVHAPVGDLTYGGMYISTDGNGGKPFYGYSAGGNSDMWHYYDGATGSWHVNNGGNRLTVESTGSVGIGTATPSHRLHVVTPSAAPAIYSQSTAPSGIGMKGEAPSVGVQGVTSGPTGIGVMGAALAGAVINYGVYGASNSINGYDVYAGGGGINYGASSSIRWKRNIERIDDPLYKLSKLRGVYYDWDAEHGGHHDVGMIAEEVGAVVPEIVQYEENGIDAHGMDYSKLTPLLVEAVNALRAEKNSAIASLRAENELLVSRLESLEQLVERLVSTQEEQME